MRSLRVRFYLWAFGCRWLPRKVRVWACIRGGRILVRGEP